MISLKVLCVTLIITQPAYSHPHNTVPRNSPSFGLEGAARFMHPFNTAHFSHQLVTKRQASDILTDEED